MATITQIDVPFLSQLGAEALALFAERNFQGVADRFDYALAYERSPALAIAADLETALSDGQKSCEVDGPSINVKYFEPGKSHLVALVECVMLFGGEIPILIELIVTSSEGKTYITLEDISPVRACGRGEA